jgi:chaperonin GroES
MRLEPTLNRLIVRPKGIETNKTTASGIVIPDVVQQSEKNGKPELGTVVAVGPGKFHPKTGELVPMSAKVGDTVLFSRMSGQEIAFGDQKVVSVFEDDIIGIVRD